MKKSKFAKKIFVLIAMFAFSIVTVIAAGINDYDDYFKKAGKKDKPDKIKKTTVERKTVETVSNRSDSYKSVSLNLGYVDISSLCVIHPISDFYYAHEKSFVKPYEGDTIKEREREFKDRMIDRKRKVAEAKKKIESLRVKIKQEEKKKDLIRNRLDTKIRMMRSSMIDKLRKMPSKNRKSYRNRIEKQVKKLENEIYKKYKKSDEKIAKIANNYKKYKSLVNTTFYAESDQKQEIVNKIIEDIYQAVKKIGRQKKFDQIFNSSFFGNRLHSLHQNQYELLFNEKNDYQMFKVIPSYALGIAGDKKEYYKNKLNSQSTYIEPFWNSNFIRKALIVGGEDITVQIIKIVFSKYGKPASDIEAAVNAYNNAKNKF
ncbi:hypothetical protein KAJ27_12900 [bacterium]|nr:hypothetical protein [bacterium]